MKQYTERLAVMISRTQSETLEKLRNRNINTSQFVRQAINEKIHRDYKQLKEKRDTTYVPF